VSVNRAEPRIEHTGWSPSAATPPPSAAADPAAARDEQGPAPRWILSWPGRGEALLEVAADIDLLTSDDLDATIQDIILIGPSRLTLDLSGVGFFGARGAGSVVRAAAVASRSGARLSLVTGRRADEVLDRCVLGSELAGVERHSVRAPAERPSEGPMG
jgi:anti-anti-sigma regulatory factor